MFAFLPRGAIWAAYLMAAQPTKIEQGSGASMFETVFDVRGDGILSGKARPRGKRAVSHLRNPCLPAVFVGGLPQPDRVCVLVVGHVHPSLSIALRHSSAALSIVAKSRST